ncbi:MAG TPA: hypothetical protein VL588_06525, partial [Bdellovibrionota bacterium]|nr:hypothetical protein [Bdellovibrionota bacterium]
MNGKTWMPEVLAALMLGLIVLTAGACSHEDIVSVCNKNFPRASEASACVIGAEIAGEKGNLVDAEKSCRDCYVDGGHCPWVGIDAGVPWQGSSLEETAAAASH